ncbi:MAG: 5'/3'-nucleotidase SurE [Candidatus Aminicenantaceae bacterium]
MTDRNNSKKPLILLTNDDGFFSEGIKVLSQHLKETGRVFIVAPDREKSATSLALTLHRPLKVQKIEENIYAADGTPADCIYLAVKKLLPRKPDIIISGLNQGPNLGQQDISYSGTVAAAIQGAYLQIPSVAISLLHDDKRQFFFEFSAQIARRTAESILENDFPHEVALNINIPPPPVKGIKITKLGQKRYDPEIIEKKDPRNKTYYWLGTGNPKAIGDEDSDVVVVKQGYISITPLQFDLTDHQALRLPYLRKLLSNIENENT